MNALSVETADTELEVQFPEQLALDREAFFAFCQANPDLRIERDGSGKVIVMAPVGSETSGRNASLTAQLYNWARKNGVGKAFDATGGFELPNGATRNPDAAWIPFEKWNLLPAPKRRKFAPLCPDFVLELRSETDRLPVLLEKMKEYSANGAKLGILLDPFEGKTYLFRPAREAEILNRPATLSAEPEMPGLMFDLGDVW